MKLNKIKITLGTLSLFMVMIFWTDTFYWEKQIDTGKVKLKFKCSL